MQTNWRITVTQKENRETLLYVARESGFQTGQLDTNGGDPIPFIRSIADNCLVELEIFAKNIEKRNFDKYDYLLKGHIAEINNLKDQVDDLHKQKFSRFNNEDCWIYQGEDDHLESLVCPVVISASELIRLKKLAGEYND